MPPEPVEPSDVDGDGVADEEDCEELVHDAGSEDASIGEAEELQSKVKDLKARLALSEAETRVADNETRLQEWLVHLAERKYDRLQEKLLALAAL